MGSVGLVLVLLQFEQAENQVSERGHGLGGMAERAKRIGGQLHVISSPGGGTGIGLNIPRHPPETVDQTGNARELT